MIGMLSTYPKKTNLQLNEYAWNWKIFFLKQKMHIHICFQILSNDLKSLIKIAPWNCRHV
jgi:hypothetical protein